MHLHLFNIFILYPGNFGGGLTVAGIKTVKIPPGLGNSPEKSFNLATIPFILLQNTLLLLLNNACMRSTMMAVSNNTGYVG